MKCRLAGVAQSLLWNIKFVLLAGGVLYFSGGEFNKFSVFSFGRLSLGTGDLFLSLLATVHLTVIGQCLWFCMLVKDNMWLSSYVCKSCACLLHPLVAVCNIASWGKKKKLPSPTSVLHVVLWSTMRGKLVFRLILDAGKQNANCSVNERAHAHPTVKEKIWWKNIFNMLNLSLNAGSKKNTKRLTGKFHEDICNIFLKSSS